MTWDDVAGLHEAKRLLMAIVVVPTRFPGLFPTPPLGEAVLLYGPPGTGKTHLARAAATAAQGSFFDLSSSDIVSMYVGKSEQLLRGWFERAMAAAPAILFVDEVDSIAGARAEGEEAATRLKNELLVQMTRGTSVFARSDPNPHPARDVRGLLILAATNRPWALDVGFRRRFRKRIYVPLPDAEAREAMIHHGLRKLRHSLRDEEITALALDTEGCSGDDITGMIDEAAMRPALAAQEADFFVPAEGGGYTASDEPGCPYCPMRLSGMATVEVRCTRCGTMRSGLLDLPTDAAVGAPPLAMAHFVPPRPTVARADLARYEAWTEEFGKRG